MVNDPKKIVERLSRSNGRALGDNDSTYKEYQVELDQDLPEVDETEVKLEDDETTFTVGDDVKHDL